MSHREFEQLLSDYVDGYLPGEKEREVADHLAECEVCRTQVRGLESLLTELAELPEEMMPSRDLWADIEDEFDAKKVVAVDFGGKKQVWFRRLKLAAAAVVLMGVSSAITAFWMDRPVEVARTEGAKGAVVSADLRAFEATYSLTIEELSGVLQVRREALSPRTVQVIEKNLNIIDEAIRTSREALAADPGNRGLIRAVAAMYEEKVALLQRVADLPNGS